ncbi:MAG: hypothetical protein K6L81_09080 [Agarilytica sp.]
MKLTTSVMVSDLDIALAFFESLELFSVQDNSLGGFRSGSAVPKGNADRAIEIQLVEAVSDEDSSIVGKQALPNKCLLYIEIEEFDSWHEKMVGKLIGIGPVKDFPWGASAIVKDPFGNPYAFNG